VFHGNASEDCVSQNFPEHRCNLFQGQIQGVQKSTEAYPQRLFPNEGLQHSAGQEIAGPWLWIRLYESSTNEKSFPMQDLLRLQKSVSQCSKLIGRQRHFGGGQCVNLKSITCRKSAIASTNSGPSSTTRLSVLETHSHR
jgi:hypothetical protein